MTSRVLLNIDAGEMPSEPDALYAVAHLVHVACGGHAGDHASMDRVVALALTSSTRIGAHPSYPDRANFGRTTMKIDPGALAASLRAQCEALRDVAAARGATVTSVKPHGALYHDANRDPLLAATVVDVARDVFGSAVAVAGPPAGELSRIARDRSLPFLAEGFADRGARADGSLIPRGQPGALVTDPEVAAQQAIVLARSGTVDTICVHGDTAGALDIATRVRAALDALGARD